MAIRGERVVPCSTAQFHASELLHKWFTMNESQTDPVDDLSAVGEIRCPRPEYQGVRSGQERRGMRASTKKWLEAIPLIQRAYGNLSAQFAPSHREPHAANESTVQDCRGVVPEVQEADDVLVHLERKQHSREAESAECMRRNHSMMVLRGR